LAYLDPGDALAGDDAAMQILGSVKVSF